MPGPPGRAGARARVPPGSCGPSSGGGPSMSAEGLGLPLVCPVSGGPCGQLWAGHEACPEGSEPARGAQGPRGARASGPGDAEAAQGRPLSDGGRSGHVDGCAWCLGSELVITLHREGHRSWPSPERPRGSWGGRLLPGDSQERLSQLQADLSPGWTQAPGRPPTCLPLPPAQPPNLPGHMVPGRPAGGLYRGPWMAGCPGIAEDEGGSLGSA